MLNITKAINESIELYNQRHLEPKLIGAHRNALQKWLTATFYTHAVRFENEQAIKEEVGPIISVYVTNNFSLKEANTWISGIEKLALKEVPEWLAPGRSDPANYYDNSYTKIYRRDGLFCVYCGMGLTAARVELDHLFPKFLFRANPLGNPNASANVVCSCGSCNSKKDNYFIPNADGSRHEAWTSRRVYIQLIREYILSESEDAEVTECVKGIPYRKELPVDAAILENAQQYWRNHSVNDAAWLKKESMIEHVSDYV